MHVTLAYLGDAADLEAADRQDIIASVALAIDGMTVITGEGFAISMFNPPGTLQGDGKQRDSCIVLGLSGDDLDGVHALVEMALADTDVDVPDQHAPWHPHITLVYTDDPGRVSTLVDRAGEVTFDRVRVAFADSIFDIPLVPPAEDPYEPVAGEVAAAAGDEDALKHYWTATPEGLAKWRDKSHPWTELYRHLRKFVGAERARRIASQWFREVLGYWPGSRRGKSFSAPG